MRQQWETALAKVSDEAPRMRQQANGSRDRIQARMEERKDQFADVRDSRN